MFKVQLIGKVISIGIGLSVVVTNGNNSTNTTSQIEATNATVTNVTGNISLTTTSTPVPIPVTTTEIPKVTTTSHPPPVTVQCVTNVSVENPPTSGVEDVDDGILEVLVLSISRNSFQIQSYYWRKRKVDEQNQTVPLGKNEVCSGADLAIQIPVTDLQDPNGMYRLDYTPSVGFPLPNTTFRAVDISSAINFSEGLPGTKYNFRVYYTNNTIHDWLTWTASITTTPDPPSNLSINVRNGKTVQLNWDPPQMGGYSKFKLRLIPLSDLGSVGQTRNFLEEQPPFLLRDLVSGASYEVQLYTLYENKESVAYISRNFTTKPNTPGRFIVWYRNETTLLVLWQPPYPAGIFTHYKVQIEPQDAIESVIDVPKEGEPPGPAQAAFNNLIPGRAYNISVETVSEDQISAPTTAQYRTVPLRPGNITFDMESLTSHSFRVKWLPPVGTSEFDRYQVQNQQVKHTPINLARDQPPMVTFDQKLEPGHTYTVIVKTFSGKVASWPVTANVTTLPLHVEEVHTAQLPDGDTIVTWSPSAGSKQDNYKITSQESESYLGDAGNHLLTTEPKFLISALSPAAGRNYSIAIQAVSNKMESEEVVIYQVTRPSSPIVLDLRAIANGLFISWKSDVTSRQDMYLIQYTRNDTGETFNETTVEGQITIRNNIFPGAAYNIQLYAISHELLSEKHTYFQAVFPNPPHNLTVLRVSTTSVYLRWLAPVGSLFSGYVVKYRTYDNESSTELHIPELPTEKDVKDLTPGEKYIFRVHSMSYKVESASPLQVIQTTKPSSVIQAVPLVDASNMTLTWDRLAGRIEAYDINWTAIDPILSSELDKTEETDSGSDPINKSSVELLSGEKVVTQQVWEDVIRIPISPLMSGVAYSIEIGTSSYGMKGDRYTIVVRTLPLITSEIYIVNDINQRTEVTLRYTATPSSISLFDRYRFQLSDPSIPPKEVPADSTHRSVTFDGLVQGRLYNFTVWTVSKDVTSRPRFRQDRLYPESITRINASVITPREITLEWKIPDGDFDGFEVQYIDAEDRYVENFTPQPTVTINGLRPFKNYTFTVIVRSGSDSTVLRKSTPLSAVFSTKENVPGKVQNFRAIDVEPNNITFEWSLPENDYNGVLLHYIIRYGTRERQNESRKFNPTDTTGTIAQLQPGITYVFGIEAYTKIGPGPATQLSQKMPIWPPPPPPEGVFPSEVLKTSSTIVVRFRNTYFSHKNGRVQKYTIIVTEDDEKNASGLELPTWSDVQAYDRWPPYQVVEPYNPFEDGPVEDFEIGTNRSCPLTPPPPSKAVYCNGPLKAGTSYRVKIRAFTASDKYTDTEYSQPIVTEHDNTWLILGLTIPLSLIILSVMSILYIRRRCSGFCGRGKSGENRGDTSSIPESVIDISRPVKLNDFSDHYRHMSADSDFRFSEEFEELKRVGRDQICAAADLSVNRPKNRFTNILPYDHSRFKLQSSDDEDGSDYINANYVTGFNSPREFIVTQGPLPSTRDDFWRMCWESNSRAIVMLTRCVEKGREKCDRYWPYDTSKQYYGNIEVQILNESRYPDWNVSEFKLERGNQCRLLKHFHFTTWPDFGVPDPPQTLVRFVRAFRERVPPEQERVRPIIVHCSAGVGRSGTFIALDRILQQIRKCDIVDIFGIVYSMRKERVWMVQTEQQYICIHQCLMAVLDGKENEIPSPREIHANDGFEDDEGIAESGM